MADVPCAAPCFLPRTPFHVLGLYPQRFRGERELHCRLGLSQKFQRPQRNILLFHAQGHDVEVHAVELDFRVEHGQAGGGEVDSG